MKNIRSLYALFFVILFISFSSCSDDNYNEPSPQETIFGIFEVMEDERTVEMDGDIDSNSLDDFLDLIEYFPNIESIEIVECGGSLDDEINLQLSLRVHQLGISTHLLDNGLIASGGVDFFLAGVSRTKGSNTMIGVHSWATEDDNGNPISATDYPVGHVEHLPYINYYVDVGFTQQEAEDFYYFTINAAAPEDMHYMTEQEIADYKILKD